MCPILILPLPNLRGWGNLEEALERVLQVIGPRITARALPYPPLLALTLSGILTHSLYLLGFTHYPRVFCDQRVVWMAQPSGSFAIPDLLPRRFRLSWSGTGGCTVGRVDVDRYSISPCIAQGHTRAILTATRPDRYIFPPSIFLPSWPSLGSIAPFSRVFQTQVVHHVLVPGVW